MCGEKAASVLLDDVVLGSPPRVRGKALSQYTTTKTAGITPACAGKRVDINTNDGVLEDHPRVCGEKFFPNRKQRKAMGSPPRVRGKD